jgi:hypothetical protein
VVKVSWTLPDVSVDVFMADVLVCDAFHLAYRSRNEFIMVRLGGRLFM